MSLTICGVNAACASFTLCVAGKIKIPADIGFKIRRSEFLIIQSVLQGDMYGNCQPVRGQQPGSTRRK